jgi:hypothetical protein
MESVNDMIQYSINMIPENHTLQMCRAKLDTALAVVLGEVKLCSSSKKNSNKYVTLIPATLVVGSWGALRH